MWEDRRQVVLSHPTPTITITPNPTPTPGKNGRHFVDNIFRCIFMNEKFCILIKILHKYVPEGPVANNTTLV